MRTGDQIKAEIIERFGFFPPFFEPALTIPDILENLWQQTLSAYVNNPIPPVFKERLFAYLSRYCSVPYCIICHSCALRPMGMSARDILEMLKISAPFLEEDISDNIALLKSVPSPLDQWPDQDSLIEKSISACSVFIFLNPAGSVNCRAEMRRVLGEPYYNHLIEFLLYIKTCHIWVEAHPELSYEADKRAIDNLKELMQEDPSLTDFFTNYNEKVMSEQKREKEQILSTLAELRKAEEELRESEERFRATFEQAAVGIAHVAPDGRWLRVNQKICDIVGYTREELLKITFQDITHPDDLNTDLEFVRKMLAGEIKTYSLEKRYFRKDGTIVWIDLTVALVREASGVPKYFISVVEDIMNRKIAEETIRKYNEEFEKVQRIESIGLLAGGIAHDFNNLLTSILGNINLARADADPKSKTYMRLENAESALIKATGLTQQLLTFSKGGEPVKKVSSISKLLKDSVSFALSGSKSRCEFSIPDHLWPVYVDEGQINQVFNNLIINADQAMPNGGLIQISCENVVVLKGEIVPLTEGKYVKVSIKDNGVGIPVPYLDKIFDPYFTTKEKGKGLGLATSFSIVRKHGGHIRAESMPGAGAAFYVYLTAMSEASYPDNESVGGIFTGKGKILIMDDEEDVRFVAREMLETLGYDVETACDGEEAIESYKMARDADRPFDLVIMDLTISGRMGGKEAIKRLKEISPSVKAIVSSGYANDPIIANYKDYGFMSILPKPYTLENLSTTVNDILNG